MLTRAHKDRILSSGTTLNSLYSVARWNRQTARECEKPYLDIYDLDRADRLHAMANDLFELCRELRAREEAA